MHTTYLQHYNIYMFLGGRAFVDVARKAKDQVANQSVARKPGSGVEGGA